jgi:hypothetical protein
MSDVVRPPKLLGTLLGHEHFGKNQGKGLFTGTYWGYLGVEAARFKSKFLSSYFSSNYSHQS